MENEQPKRLPPFQVFGAIEPQDFKWLIEKLLIGYLKGDPEGCTNLAHPALIRNVEKLQTYLEKPFENDENEIFEVVEKRLLHGLMDRLLLGYLFSLKEEPTADYSLIVTYSAVVIENLLDDDAEELAQLLNSQ